MQQIDDTKKLVNDLNDRERQSLIRIKETQELIQLNRRLIARSHEILSSAAPEMAAILGRANSRT
ncbi:hypothetical protein [Mesorhizobium cantuariense]|uniref:Uncharacterized protein n=1 Tax=Mesorhizobium cantuariense TaxID=1300275 RepID=A0ABV7MNJ9_9HYPH